MKTHTNVQILKNAQGMPEFAVIPYVEYLALSKSSPAAALIPHAVVTAVVEKGMTPVRAWREYLDLTQVEVAEKMGITQAAYQQQESKESLTKSAREKIALALSITFEQLDF